jgi:hypothetical protein
MTIATRDARRETKAAAARREQKISLVDAISLAAPSLPGFVYSFVDSILDTSLVASALI